MMMEQEIILLITNPFANDDFSVTTGGANGSASATEIFISF